MIGCVCILLAIYYYWTNRRDKAAFLLFFVLTAGFQLLPLSLMTLPAMGVSKCYDWAFAFVGCILLVKPKVFFQLAVWKNNWALSIYLAFLVILLYYSIFVKEIEVSVAVRVFRNFMFFISLFLFTPLSVAEMKLVWKWIVYATSLCALLYCSQLVTHISVLNGVTSDGELYVRNTAMTRYYNVPVFICPVVFFLFFSKNTFDIRYRNLLLGINVLAVLLTQHRNLIIAVFCCFFIWYMLNNRLKPVTLLYFLLVPAIYMIADNLLGNRLSKGMDDIGQVSVNNDRIRFSEISLSDLSTTEFRRLLFIERLDYIKKDDTRFLLGIGLLTDDSQKAKSLRFYIGIPDDDGNISQIANVDIAWASLLLQLGVIGTVLFIFVHLFLLKRFFWRRADPYLQTGILYLIALFVSSFYGSIIAMPYTMCMVMLFAAYYLKTTVNTEAI
jgi:hypothetical protein